MEMRGDARARGSALAAEDGVARGREQLGCDGLRGRIRGEGEELRPDRHAAILEHLALGRREVVEGDDDLGHGHGHPLAGRRDVADAEDPDARSREHRRASARELVRKADEHRRRRGHALEGLALHIPVIHQACGEPNRSAVAGTHIGAPAAVGACAAPGGRVR